MAEQITVYTTGPSCVRCTLTKKVLTTRGITFVEVDIRDDEAAHAYIVGLGYTKAPVVITDQGHWSGFRPDLIDRITSNR